MALASVVQGADHVKQNITWKDDAGTAVDLSGATITGYKRDKETGATTALTGTLALEDATNGVFSWLYGSADTAPGSWLIMFVATYGDSTKDKTLAHNWVVHDAYDE
jgi:hypothetical protein